MHLPLPAPLITKSDGGKFGKTESGTIWLDAARTSPYQFYQFWLQLGDVDAERMIYIFSFREIFEIESLILRHRESPHQYILQKTLAEEMTVMVHSADDLHFAQQASQILFSNTAVDALKALNEQQLLEVMEGVPQVNTTLSDDFDLLTFLADQKVFPSKGEAKKMIAAGGFSINKEKVTDIGWKPQPAQLLSGKYLLLQKGKKDFTLAVFSS